VEKKLEAWAGSLVRGIPARPWIVIGLILLISALALVQMVDPRTGTPRLLLDPSVDSMLPEGDAGRLYLDRVKTLFESGESILIAYATDDVFTQDHLARIKLVTERIEEQAEVRYAASLSTALNIRNESGSLSVEPFYDEVPEDVEALSDLRTRALGDPIVSGNLISRDGRIAVIAIDLLDFPEQELLASGIDDRIRAIAEGERGDAKLFMAGGAHVKAETSRLMFEDVFEVLPFSVLAMAIIAFLSFRTLRGVFVPTLTVLVSSIWTMGFVATFYGILNPVTVAAPPVLIVVGFAYSVHVLSAYYAELRGIPEGQWTSEGAARAALEAVALPVCFTGITTAAGFLSLMLSPITAIKQFGAFCGVGVLTTTIVSLTLAPALLAMLALPRRLSQKHRSEGFDRFLTKLAAFDLRRRRSILLVWALISGLALMGITHIEVGTDMVGNFRDDNPVRMDFEAINEELGGANAFQVVIEGVNIDDLKEPHNLSVIESLQGWLDRQPEVGGTTSLVDYIKLMHQGFRDGDDRFHTIPDSRNLVSQLLVLGENEELDRFVDTDYIAANVVVRTSAIDSADLMSLVNRLESYLEEMPRNLEARVTGNSVLVSRTMDQIAIGQALSLGAALLIIYAILALLFTSFRLGFWALLPNAIPVLVYFGVLGWTGVTLNVVTGLVACLVLGIAVDDTIHLLVHFNQAAKRRANEEKGISEALRLVGRPVTYTTIALCVGFLVLTASNMKSQNEFGALAALILAVAWINDLTFTPAMAVRMRIVTLWDILTVDLGEDPHRSIPLFSGLTLRQSRIVALMGSLRDYPKGHLLFRVGESVAEMYIVISGRLSATVEQEGKRVALRELGRRCWPSGSRRSPGVQSEEKLNFRSRPLPEPACSKSSQTRRARASRRIGSEPSSSSRS
jgi:predicted RND superfamily exporter protein